MEIATGRGIQMETGDLREADGSMVGGCDARERERERERESARAGLVGGC
jgi:hypothetical protein